MSTITDHVDLLFAVRNRGAREAGYARLAKEFGQHFADNVRDQVEAHHLIVEIERRIARGTHIKTEAKP